MVKLLSLAMLALAVHAAEDAWAKVQALKTGTEIRVYKKSSTQPVLAKFADAREDSLLIVVKNAEVAVPKAEIDRIDYRPPKPGGRVTKETKTTEEDPTKAKEPPAGMNGRQDGVGSSTSTSFSVQGKPDFETIYRRPAGRK